MVSKKFSITFLLAIAIVAQGLGWTSVVMADTETPAVRTAPESASQQPAFATTSEPNFPQPKINGDIIAPEVLARRVVERWRAMIDRNFHLAYQFCSPAFRALYTPKAHAGRYGSAKMVWERVQVQSIAADGADAAKVYVKIFSRVPLPDTEKMIPHVTVVTESWLRSEGEWWYVPDN